MSTIGRVGAVLAVLLSSGCDLTFPWSTGSQPDAPQALTISLDSVEFDVVYLTWSATPAYERYEVQWRAGAAGWQPTGGWMPLGPTQGRVALDSTVPENTPIALRIRGLAGGTPSAWSDQVTFLRGIRPPSAFTAEMGMAYTTRTGPVTLSWSNESLVATELLLERAPATVAEPTAWATLAGATLATARYVDHGLEEGVAYAYRVRVGSGGAWSAPREVRTDPVDLAAPSGLRAVKVDAGVQLTWTNESRRAETATVTRYTRDPPWWDVHLELPSVLDAWLDPAAAVWPVTAYQVTVSHPSSYQYATTAVARVEPFVLAGPPAVAAAAPRLPEGEWYARDAAGRFHLAQGVYQSPRIHRATATGWETHVLADADAFANPGILVDGDGALHSVVLRGSPYGTTEGEIVHVWWDGSAWRSEVVATDVVAPGSSWTPRAWFGLGSGGVQVVYRRAETFPDPDSLIHVAAGGEGTVMTVVTTPSVPDFSRWSASFGVATDGTAYVAQIGTSASLSQTLLLLSTRSAEGVWSDEIVPTGAAPRDGPWLAPGDAGDVAIAHTRDAVGLGDKEVRVVRKQGGWLESELATTRPHDGFTPELAFTGTADLARLALVTWSSGRTDLHVRDGSGWKGVTVGPSSVSRAGLGFVSGGAWALFPHDSAAQGLVPYSLFEEAR